MYQPKFEDIDEQFRTFFSSYDDQSYALDVSNTNTSFKFGVRGQLFPFIIRSPFVSFKTDNIYKQIYHESKIDNDICRLTFGKQLENFNVETCLYAPRDLKNDINGELTVSTPNCRLTSLLGSNVSGFTGVYNLNNVTFGYSHKKLYTGPFGQHMFKVCAPPRLSNNILANMGANMSLNIGGITTTCVSELLCPLNHKIKVGFSGEHTLFDNCIIGVVTKCGIEVKHDDNNTFKCNIDSYIYDSINVSWLQRVSDIFKVALSVTLKSNGYSKVGVQIVSD